MALCAREKMACYRSRLRAAGLKPVTIWIPDPGAEGFAEEIRRQSLRASAAEDQGLADELDAAAADIEDWEGQE